MFIYVYTYLSEILTQSNTKRQRLLKCAHLPHNCGRRAHQRQHKCSTTSFPKT